jgi:hypothetical protein
VMETRAYSSPLGGGHTADYSNTRNQPRPRAQQFYGAIAASERDTGTLSSAQPAPRASRGPRKQRRIACTDCRQAKV